MRTKEKLPSKLLREASIVFIKELSKDAAKAFSAFLKEKVKKKDKKEEPHEE